MAATRAGMRVVDLCAAPGGKAAELAAAGADLTAVDRSAERLKLLAANFERLRLRSEIVVAPFLMRSTSWLAVLSPSAVAAVSRVFGSRKVADELAAKQRSKR